MSAIVAHHTLRNAGRPRRVKNVERVGRQHRDALRGPRGGGELVPVVVASGDETGPARRPLQDDAMLGLRLRLGDGRVEQRLVLDDAADLDAAGGRQDHPRAGGVDPDRQLMRREPAKDDRMDRADARAGQHRHRRLRHHRHIDQHPVAFADAEPGENPAEVRYPIAQFPIGESHDLVGDRAVPDQRDPLAAAGHDMAVERVPAGVEPGAGEPAVKRRPGRVEHPLPAPLPVDRLGRLGPEFLGPLDRPAIGFGVSRHHWPPLCRLCREYSGGSALGAKFFARSGGAALAPGMR